MKIKLYLSVVFVVTFFLFSCTFENKKDLKNSIKTYYNNGNLKSERIFLNDSVINSIYRSYYDNGQLEFEVPYIGNLKEGIYKAFDTNGKISAILNYRNDSIQGKAVWFYSSGMTKSIYFYDKGKLNGETFLYSEEGKINSYLYNIDGLSYYRADYDKSGAIVKQSGNAIIQIVTNTDSVLNRNESVKARIVLAVPPNYFCKVYLKESGLSSKRNLGLKNKTSSFEYHWEQKGEYSLFIIAELSFLKENNINLIHEYKMNFTVR